MAVFHRDEVVQFFDVDAGKVKSLQKTGIGRFQAFFVKGNTPAGTLLAEQLNELIEANLEYALAVGDKLNHGYWFKKW